MKNLTPELKKELFPDDLILLGYRGSIAHNMYVPNTDPDSIDDIDLMGVFMAPADHYIGLKQVKETREKFVDKYDVVHYEFVKFVRLLLNANPNVLSLLWLKDNHYLKMNAYGRGLIKHRDIFVSKKAYYSFTGYAYSQLKKMENHAFKGYMGEKRKVLVEKYGYDCYDCVSTEFLTTSGWKSYDDITGSDKLATVEPITGEIEFQNYSNRIDKVYTGSMYSLEPYNSKCFITENHNVLVSPARRGPKNNYSHKYEEAASDWGLVALKSLLEERRSHYHVRVSGKCLRKDFSVEDAYLQLAGLFVSEGTVNFRNGKCKSIRFTQTKSNNGFYTLARKLMSTYEIKEYLYEKETVWVLHGDVAKSIYNDFGHKKDKKLPHWCFNLSNRQARLFFESLMLGDGCDKATYSVYYTSIKKLADDIHAMLTSSGILSTVTGPYMIKGNFGDSTNYHVYVSKLRGSEHCVNFGRLLKSGETAKSKEGYPVKEIFVENNRVVCFEVPNGTLITRNNGRVSIHGNCKNAAHCIRLLKMGMEFLSTGQLNVFRKDAPMLLDIKRGKWTLEKVKQEAERLFNLADEAFVRSTLPDEPDYEKANWLVMEALRFELGEYNGLKRMEALV